MGEVKTRSGNALEVWDEHVGIRGGRWDEEAGIKNGRKVEFVGRGRLWKMGAGFRIKDDMDGIRTGEDKNRVSEERRKAFKELYISSPGSARCTSRTTKMSFFPQAHLTTG